MSDGHVFPAPGCHIQGRLNIDLKIRYMIDLHFLPRRCIYFSSKLKTSTKKYAEPLVPTQFRSRDT